MSNPISAYAVMTKSLVTGALNETVAEALQKLTSHRLTSLPIVETTPGTPVGVLSELALVKILLRCGSSPKDQVKLEEFRSLIDPIITIYESASLDEVVKSLIRNSCHRAYVINGANKSLVGVISPKDVIKLLTADDGEPSLPTMPQLLQENEELLAQLKELESQHELYTSLIDDSPLMMHSINRKGEIKIANRTLHRLLGYLPDELVGKSIYDLYPQNMHQSVKEGLYLILQNGYHDLIETAMVAKDKSLVKVEVISSSIFGADGIREATITVGRPSDPLMMSSTLRTIVKNWPKPEKSKSEV